MKFWCLLAVMIALVGCGENAFVEFGMNDATLKEGAAGDLRMRVLRIEVPDGGQYITVWEGIEYVSVELGTDNYASITNGYESIEPKSYSSIRVTVDSLSHVQQTFDTLLIDSTITFVAQAFSPIVISDGDEFRLVVVIAAESWFDEDSSRIIPGAEPFENAALRIYEY
jgi:hypothetical protein